MKAWREGYSYWWFDHTQINLPKLNGVFQALSIWQLFEFERYWSRGNSEDRKYFVSRIKRLLNDYLKEGRP